MCGIKYHWLGSQVTTNWHTLLAKLLKSYLHPHNTTLRNYRAVHNTYTGEGSWYGIQHIMYTLANVYNTYEWSWYTIDTDKMVCVYYTLCCIGVWLTNSELRWLFSWWDCTRQNFTYERGWEGGREDGRERERERGNIKGTCISVYTDVCSIAVCPQ